MQQGIKISFHLLYEANSVNRHNNPLAALVKILKLPD